MFLVTWIEGEEVNYRLVKKQELSALINSINQISQNLIVQKLAS